MLETRIPRLRSFVSSDQVLRGSISLLIDSKAHIQHTVEAIFFSILELGSVQPVKRDVRNNLHLNSSLAVTYTHLKTRRHRLTHIWKLIYLWNDADTINWAELYQKYHSQTEKYGGQQTLEMLVHILVYSSGSNNMYYSEASALDLKTSFCR